MRANVASRMIVAIGFSAAALCGTAVTARADPPQDKKQHQQKDHAQHGPQPQKQQAQARPQQAIREAPPQQVHRNPPPQQAHREAPPQQVHRNPPPQQVHREAPPQQAHRQAAPQQVRREPPQQAHHQATPQERRQPQQAQAHRGGPVERLHAAPVARQQAGVRPLPPQQVRYAPQAQPVRVAPQAQHVRVAPQAQHARLAPPQQQALISQQQQRLTQYRSALTQDRRVAEQQSFELQRQHRTAQYSFMRGYLSRLEQQDVALRRRHYDYYSDPYFYTPADYRYYRAGRYYETNEYGVDLLRQALNTGYREGWHSGVADREDGWRPSYQSCYAYQDANYGYDGYYLDQPTYNYYFREGFRRGYEDGYYGRYRYGRYSNGTVSLLSPVLNVVLRVERF